jgi:predicted TPR repeat methyltransferase
MCVLTHNFSISEKNFVLENWQVSLCKLIIKELKPMTHEILLDVGCGNGWLASITQNANISYLGLDISNAVVDKA